MPDGRDMAEFVRPELEQRGYRVFEVSAMTREGLRELGFAMAEIVDAAREALEAGGLDALSMRRLADRLGIRAPSLYKHFPDKGALEAALMADGVAPDKLYPLDVDRAFRKLEEIKPNITVWWTSGAQSAQLLNDGEVDMVMAWNGRVSALMGEGAKVGFTFNQGILQSTSLCILKGAPNLATAVRFVNEAVDPVNQANLPLHIDYGPANPKAFDTGVIKPERVVQLPSAPDNAAKQALMSYAWWSSPAGEAAEKRWVSFMQK